MAFREIICRIALTTIVELFDGKVASFIKQNILVFGGIRELIESQINRLCEMEKQVLSWLAVKQNNLLLTQGTIEEIPPGMTKIELLETLESLVRRSLIYKQTNTFKMLPLLKEYLNQQFPTQNSPQKEANRF